MGYDSYRTSRIFYYMAIAIKMYGNTTTYTYDKLLRLTSYVNQAGDDYTYFSIENCGQIQSQYGFDDNDMFMLFNEPFLDDGINSGKIFSFLHNPIGDTGALGREFQYLLQNGYQFDEFTLLLRQIF